MIFIVEKELKSRFFRARRRLLVRPKTTSIFTLIFHRKSHQNDLKMETKMRPKPHQDDINRSHISSMCSRPSQNHQNLPKSHQKSSKIYLKVIKIDQKVHTVHTVRAGLIR